jgi:hypothetical protein
MKNWVAAAMAFAVLLQTSGELAASEPTMTSLDHTLLDADAIVLATVESVSQVDDATAAIGLRPVRIVENRWNSKSALQKLHVRGTVFDDGGTSVVRFNRERPAIQRGRTYVFLLRGGPSSEGPFVDAHIALLRVSDKDNSVECGSGSVYGVTSHMVICGAPDTSYGAPMAVSEVCDALGKQLLRAKQIRPKLLMRRIADLRADPKTS